jgi:hypothetical protein
MCDRSLLLILRTRHNPVNWWVLEYLQLLTNLTQQGNPNEVKHQAYEHFPIQK